MSSPICIIVPVYNSHNRLRGVLDELLQLPYPVWVIDDGSDDDMLEQLSDIQHIITLISYPKNRGKAYALQQGFIAAAKAGYHYAVTMDADGQHQVKDVLLFVEKMKYYPNALLIGTRDFSHPNMPNGNRFANRFSNFWFMLQTGIKLPDTQTGFRLYPLHGMGNMRLFTHRYEGELELLVRCAWRGISIQPVAIDVIYFSKNERISHFRPWNDFLRISLLNTVLCCLSIFYGHPRRLFLKIFRRKR